MPAILGKTTGEAIFILKVNEIAKKYGVKATLDFNNKTLHMDGDIEQAVLALDEIQKYFGDEI